MTSHGDHWPIVLADAAGTRLLRSRITAHQLDEPKPLRSFGAVGQPIALLRPDHAADDEQLLRIAHRLAVETDARHSRIFASAATGKRPGRRRSRTRCRPVTQVSHFVLWQDGSRYARAGQCLARAPVTLGIRTPSASANGPYSESEPVIRSSPSEPWADEEATKVRDAMTRNVGSCLRGTKLAAAAKIVWPNRCGVVPVVERVAGRAIWAITDRDICMVAATKHPAAPNIGVAEVASGAMIHCGEHDEMKLACQQMHGHEVRRGVEVVERGRFGDSSPSLISGVQWKPRRTGRKRELGQKGAGLPSQAVQTGMEVAGAHQLESLVWPTWLPGNSSPKAVG